MGKCEIDNREKTLAISKSTQKSLCPNLDNLNDGDLVISEELAKCYVTLCRHKGKNFWLITKFEPKRSRCLSIQNLRIAPEEILDYWEKYGIEKTAEELTLFVKFANPGDSLQDWNLSEDSEQSIDRGSFNISKEDLIAFFLKNKNVTSLHRKKAVKLMIDSIPVNADSKNIDIVKLLDIWEDDGLDAAVLAWKEMSKKPKPKSPKKKMDVNNQSSQNTFLMEMGLSAENFAALEQEIAEDGGIPIDLGIDWDDVPFDDESEIIAEL